MQTLPIGISTLKSIIENDQEYNYAQKYVGQADRKVFELGMVFSQEKHNLVCFDFNGK